MNLKELSIVADSLDLSLGFNPEDKGLPSLEEAFSIIKNNLNKLLSLPKNPGTWKPDVNRFFYKSLEIQLGQGWIAVLDENKFKDRPYYFEISIYSGPNDGGHCQGIEYQNEDELTSLWDKEGLRMLTEVYKGLRRKKAPVVKKAPSKAVKIDSFDEDLLRNVLFGDGVHYLLVRDKENLLADVIDFIYDYHDDYVSVRSNPTDVQGYVLLTVRAKLDI